MVQLTLPVGERDHVQGLEDAPVTLIEYGDYQCSNCRQVHFIVKEIQQRLGKQLRFAFRHFPLMAIHPYAQYAAEIAEAASAQGRFWEIHEFLFEYQQTLGGTFVLKYSTQLGLDSDQLEQEVAEHRYAQLVREDLRSGISSGVNGTPTFFINRIRYEGPWNLERLLAAIKEANNAQSR